MSRPELRKAIREAMRARGIPSVTELVNRAEVTRNTLYNWEGGKTAPALDELERVAVALEVPLSVLVDAWSGRTPDTTKEPPEPAWVGRLEARLEELQKSQTKISAPAELEQLVPELIARLEALLPPPADNPLGADVAGDPAASRPPTPEDAGHSHLDRGQT